MVCILSACLATLLFLVAGSVSLFENMPWLSTVIKTILCLALPLSALLPAKPNAKECLPKRMQRHHLPLLWLIPFFVAMTFGLSLLFGYIGSFFDLTLPTYKGNLWGLLLLHALIPALTEEFCFRHVIWEALRPLDRQASLFGSALLFAIAHVSPLMMAYAFAAGLFLGLLRTYTQSLWLPILFHFLNNSFCLVLMQYRLSASLWAWGITTVIGLLGLLIFYYTEKDTFSAFFSPLFHRADKENIQK